MNTSKVAAYIRVSTVGQNEAGQVEAVKAYCKSHGLEPVWFIDKASGDNLDRPEFKKLEEAIFRGSVDTVLVFKLDRLSRSLRDGLMTLYKWLDSGVRIVSVTQQFDFSGALGKMLASVLLGVAEMEQETRRERQAEGIKVAKTKGLYQGRKVGTGKHKPDKVRELRAKGLSYSEIATALGCSTKTVQRALKGEAVA